MRKKRVFFILNSNIYSGAEKVNIDIIEGLKDKYDFFYVSRKGSINEFLDEKHINWIEIKKLTTKEIKRVIKEYKPDILHATDFRASFICALVKRNIPLISHLHNNPPWLKKMCFNSFALLFATKKANKILTVSDSIEKEFIFSKFIKNKIECIGNPISRESVLRKVNEGNYEKKYDICCVARLTEQKDPYKLMDIIKALKEKRENVKCVWVGQGELKEECKKYAQLNGIENNIDFVGFQKNPYKYMAKSRVFLLTSKWEGFGLVAFEALTLGLPCVVSDVGGLKEIVSSKCGLLCSDLNHFVCEINLLLNDITYYRKKSTEAILQSEKLDNSVDYYKTLKKIYDDYK